MALLGVCSIQQYKMNKEPNMKAIKALIFIASTLVLHGCVSMQSNPEFRNCANTCTKKQDECMVDATTSKAVASCNSAMDSCIARCEKKYPRYIQPK